MGKITAFKITLNKKNTELTIIRITNNKKGFKQWLL